jgi:hypothetical protein
MSRLIDDLNTLHDGYVSAINTAVARDDLDRVQALAAEYDDEAVLMIAEREGKAALLPLRRPRRRNTPLSRFSARRRSTGRRAA